MTTLCYPANLVEWGNRIFTIEMIDARLLVHDQEEITAGEAVAGVILNGLGFSDRPLTFGSTPFNRG